MMQKTHIAILSLLLLLSCNIFATATQANILILGDSLSAGFMLEKGEEWPALLQNTLDDSAIKFIVVNASISGETTTGGLSRVQALLDKHQPRWLILELGANDGLQGSSLKQMHSNLEKIIQLASSKSCEVLLVGMHIPPNYGKRYSDSFYQVYLKLQHSYQLSFVPFILDGVAGKPEMNLADGIHPIAAAQPQVLNNIWSVFKPLLTQKP